MDFSTSFAHALRSLTARLRVCLSRWRPHAGTPVSTPVPRTQQLPLPAATVNLRTATCLPRILLAEDTEINRQLVLLLLSKKGWIVDAVINGQLALDALATARYDLVLMDCMMPVMDGYAAVEQLRIRENASGCERVPVVGMTASVTEGERERCLAAGMDDYLAKPFTANALALIVERWRLRARV